MCNMFGFLWVPYRYGPWMDTNLVLPLGARKCKVIFDYFLDASLKVSFSCIIVESFGGYVWFLKNIRKRKKNTFDKESKYKEKC